MPNVTQFETTSSCRLLKITDDIKIYRHIKGDCSCYTPCTTEKAEVAFGRQRLCDAKFGTAPATPYVVDRSLSVT